MWFLNDIIGDLETKLTHLRGGPAFLEPRTMLSGKYSKPADNAKIDAVPSKAEWLRKTIVRLERRIAHLRLEVPG